jgi:iron complex transport system substrate-binding protein
MKRQNTGKVIILLICAILLFSAIGCSEKPVATAPPATTFGIGNSYSTAPAATTTATTVPAPTTITTAAPPAPRTIKDMYGTELTIPGVIDHVIATGPVETQLIYILAPEKLAGMNMVWNGALPYIPDKYKNITNIGNASSGSFNFEAAIAVVPDIVLEGKTKNLANDREKFGKIPVVGVNAGDDLLTMYDNEIRYVADLLGVPERGQELLTYYHEAMDYTTGIVSKLTDAEKVRVYYAEGSDGLQTDAQGSWHTNLLAYCGGINVAKVEVSNTSQAIQVSLEQVYAWNTEKPIDMIIIGRSSQAVTYKAILNSADWQLLQCVKNKQVYVRPDNPTSWFDGPPGYGQILGMYWMLHTLYPEKVSDELLSVKVKEFYSKFLHFELTSVDVAMLIANPI